MAVRAVILDLDGTLLDSAGQLSAGVGAMLADLEAAGLRIAVASNRLGALAKVRKAGIPHQLLLTRASVGVKKGSPKWVDVACRDLGVEPNEIVWLGDSDLDMRSASHAGIVYFNAGWSVPSYPYGITLQRPEVFGLVIRDCFMKGPRWYWTLDQRDGQDRPVVVRAMIDGNGAGMPVLKNGLLNFLKYGGNPSIGPVSVRDFIVWHLLGCIYADGSYRPMDTWTVYPSSKGGTNAAMRPFADMVAKLFRDQYVDDLLVRHTPSLDSGVSRNQPGLAAGQQIDLLNQINTVCLNLAQRDRVVGKRVLLLDDFTTDGYSIECARNLLYQAQAQDVLAVTIGKYGYIHRVVSPAAEYTWDPFSPVQHSADQFVVRQVHSVADQEALGPIRDSYGRFHLLRP